MRFAIPCTPIWVTLGAAHPLMLLVSVLEKAKAGEKILLVGFGQGADALLLECDAGHWQAAAATGRNRSSRPGARRRQTMAAILRSTI